MADLEYNEDDLQQDYDYFFEQYSPVEYEVNDENRELLKSIDPKFVWTAHSTCEDDFISPGFLEFSPSSCCWRECSWYVSNIQWKSDESSEWITVSHGFPCPECNPNNDEDIYEGKPECEICYGEAFYTYYADQDMLCNY